MKFQREDSANRNILMNLSMKRKRLETPPDSSFASLDLPLLNERSEIDMKRTKLVLSYSWTYSWTKKS